MFGGMPDDLSTEHINAVIEAVENLEPILKQAVEAIYYERIPYERLAQRLGCSKPHAWRITQKAIKELQRVLAINKTINERYTMFDNWEDACMAVLVAMDKNTWPEKANIQHLKVQQSGLGKSVRSLEAIDMETIIVIGEAAVSQMKFENKWDTKKVQSLLISKQNDYGHSNILMFGHTGIAIRMCDKIARLITLVDGRAKVKDETVLDTWSDLVGYSVIAQMLWNGTFTLSLKGDSK